jgi:hypothetical protein
MAKVAFNSSLRGLSGAIDNWVFRQVNDQTVISPRHKGPARAPSPAQIAQRDRFRRAQEYARKILADPCHRRVYDALAAGAKRRAAKLLESDFLTPPVVEAIELYGYSGRPGDVIRVIATDDVEVVSVNVALRDADEILEEGPAARVHGVWVYPATTAAPVDRPLTIEAVATDRPGNSAKGEVPVRFGA